MKVLTVILIVVASSCVSGALLKNSRAVQNYGCSCMMNKYLQAEMTLGLEYLNASNYMFHDSVAMKGFGKMFHNFWQKQLNNANTIRKYNLHRGGIAEAPYYRLRASSTNHFTNITSVIHKFIELEKGLNSDLLDLQKCSSENSIEERCRRLSIKRVYGNSGVSKITDPYTADFLDTNFIPHKVDRIKYLSDMFRSLLRFHKIHRLGDKIIDLGLNPIGVHLIDHDLESIF